MQNKQPKLLPCPFCGGQAYDLSQVTQPKYLKRFQDRGLYPVGCLSQSCSIQPTGDNESWNQRIQASNQQCDAAQYCGKQCHGKQECIKQNEKYFAVNGQCCNAEQYCGKECHVTAQRMV